MKRNSIGLILSNESTIERTHDDVKEEVSKPKKKMKWDRSSEPMKKNDVEELRS